MQYQVDFLPVGEKRCGESIAIRFGDLESGDPSQQAVVVIDGGYKNDSQKIIDTVTDHYGSNKIDLMVSTHPDIDHIRGLTGVLEDEDTGITVDYLWMHLPWEHSADFLNSRQYDFISGSMTKKLQKSMQSSSDLAAAADAAGVEIFEPFTGRQFVSPHGTLTVLGPTKVYYEDLLTQILAKSASIAAQQQPSRPLTLLEQVNQAMQRATQIAAGQVEHHHLETLTDGGTTALSNNTSTILLLELPDGEKFLFSGDAGMPALKLAHDEYTKLGHLPGQLNLVQVPHHGSRKNVGPTILDKFLGERTSNPGAFRGNACVSVTETCKGDNHPHKVATNAFNRRGYPVIGTKGRHVKFGHPRPGWTASILPMPLFDMVESDG